MAHLVPAKVEFAVIDDDLIQSCLESEKKTELEESKKKHEEYVMAAGAPLCRRSPPHW